MPDSAQLRRIRRDFRRANNRSIKQALSTTADSRRRILNLMRDFDASIAGIVAGGEISGEFLASLRASIRNEVLDLEQELFGIISTARSNVTILGETALGSSLATIPGLGGIGIGIGGVSPDLLSIANEFSADLIGLARGGLTAEILKGINRELSLGVLGGRSNADVIRRIATLLGPGKSFRNRAIQIVRTDGLRMFSMANQASLERARESLPELRKAWIWSRISRIDHAVAEEEFGEDNPIPINDPFIVAGEALMYPRDAAGSAWNVINCGCFHVGTFETLPEMALVA